MNYSARLAITAVIVGTAVLLVAWRYSSYIANPWTRDGQVAADLVFIAPRVTGPAIEVAVDDNQFVEAGDLLFRIDPRTYEVALNAAQANFERTQDEIEALSRQIEASEASVEQFRALIPSAEAQVRAAEATLAESESNLERMAILLERDDIAQTRFNAQLRDVNVNQSAKEQADIELLNAKSALTQAEATLAQARANRGKPEPNNARLNQAAAEVDAARLNLEFTEVRAPVDGYVTNVDLRIGEQLTAYAPEFALIDTSTYWVDAYFRETFLADIDPGDQAVVTLMSYPGTPIEGVVDSINWGIAPTDGTTGAGLLPNVRTTFEWIRLAQRVPVKIKLRNVPEDVKLVVGTTASVLVRSDGETGSLIPAPRFLQ
uniref:HlyD family secretion protein n=1 Tax=Tateyamaria pelophila TaxID=328415 RepID=UPI001CBBA614|nr:HlyD family secretion protein [Tateyamaria pelophila]